jgi:hypothetical protein
VHERIAIPRAAFGPDDMPLDAARAAFGWLVIGPRPLSVDGRAFPGLPDRPVPLDEVRHQLLRRRCPQPVRDAVWAHLVRRSREEGGGWTVGCVGVALPALTGIAAGLTARFVGDPRDIHAAVLAGFLAELATVDLARPRIMLRLRWAAYRSGHICLREALDAPTPSARAFHSSAPPPPSGHPDLVLVRAITAGVITAAEAELIGSTRLEEVPLAEAAARRGTGYEAAKKARQRAERRLVDFVRDDITEPGTAERTADTAATAEHTRAGDTRASRTVTVERLSGTRRRRVRRRVSPDAAHDGVQVRGRDHTNPNRADRTDPPQHPAAGSASRSTDSTSTHPRSAPRSAEVSGQIPRQITEVPRCA